MLYLSRVPKIKFQTVGFLWKTLSISFLPIDLFQSYVIFCFIIIGILHGFLCVINFRLIGNPIWQVELSYKTLDIRFIDVQVLMTHLSGINISWGFAEVLSFLLQTFNRTFCAWLTNWHCYGHHSPLIHRNGIFICFP